MFNDPLLKKHNSVSEPSLAISTPIHFSNAINSAVDTLFPGNDYDSAYFFSFIYDDCVNRTLIRLAQETADNYSSKMLVACTEYESFADTVTGYYWDTTGNHIDSLPLTAENIIDYYVWIVEADNDCLDSDDPTTVQFSFDPEGHCGNGECEPFLGEDPANCSDCVGKKTSGTYTLVLKEIEHLTDNNFGENIDDVEDYCDRGYQETYISGKYDIFFSYAVVGGCDGFASPYAPSFIKNAWFITDIQTRLLRDHYIDNQGNETKKWTDLILTRLNVGKGDVVRHFKHGNRDWTSSGGSGSVVTIDKTLCFNFDPIKDRISLKMLEWDQCKSRIENVDDISDNCFTGEVSWNPHYRQEDHLAGPSSPNISNSTGIDMNTHLPYFYGTLLGTYENGGHTDYWLSGTSLFGTGSRFVDLIYVGAQLSPSDPPFGANLIGPAGVNRFRPNKPEMRIRFVLFLNP